MKKIGVVLSLLVALSASAFALNAGAMAGEDCNEKRAAFEQQVNSVDKDSFIVQYILINLADTMEGQKDEQAAPLAQCYNTYRVKGTPMVDFVRANADIFRQKAREEEKAAPAFDKLQKQLLGFANRVERLAEQATLNEIAAHDNDDWLVQHVLGNLADPMRNMSDEQAAPKAVVYKQLTVRHQPLVSFARQQANRFAQFANNVAEDLTTFANRVETLAK